MGKCIKFLTLAVCIISTFCALKKIVKATKAILEAVNAIKVYKAQISE